MDRWRDAFAVCMMAEAMASPVDIARLLLERAGPMDTARLHKLTYYVQAWSIAQGAPAFAAPIKAWVNGPVSPPVHGQVAGRYKVSASDVKGDSASVPVGTIAVVDFVLENYGKRSTDFLIALTHFERPWLDARTGSTSQSPEISVESMRAYFTGKTPEKIEQDYQLKIVADIESRYEDAFRRLAQ